MQAPQLDPSARTWNNCLQVLRPPWQAWRVLMSDVIDSGWRFNKDYRDYSQVEAFLPSFMARLQELEAAGKYRYNDSFKGHIPGIEGPSEDSAIFMLQGLERWNAEHAKEDALVADGYEYVTDLVSGRKY